MDYQDEKMTNPLRCLLTSDNHLADYSRTANRMMMKRSTREKFSLAVLLGDFAGNVPSVPLVREFFAMWRDHHPDALTVATTGNHDCVSEDTEILTRGGWRNLNTLTLSDEVATMTTGGDVEWQQPTRIFQRKMKPDEHIYFYDSPIASIGVTSRHRMYTYGRVKKEIKVRTAETCPADFSIITALTSKSIVPYSDDYLRLAAWMCTDSSLCADKIILYQRKSNVHKILELLARLGLSYTYRERSNERTTHIMGRKLLKTPEIGCEIYFSAEDSRRVTSYLQTESNKNLPVWFSEMSDPQWFVFLKILIEADGSTIRGSETNFVFYGKKSICEDVQIGCFLHGWRASLTEYRPNHWRVNIAKRAFTRVLEFQKSKVGGYSGKVWCISIPNENFVCKRKNKIHVTGNCWFKAGRPSVDEFAEGWEHLCQIMKDYNVWFLDEDGPMRVAGFTFVGGMGWYKALNPPVNDTYYLPISLYPHDSMMKWSLKKIVDNLALINGLNDPNVVFCTHFPVLQKHELSGDPNLGLHLMQEYNCRTFMNGHAHALHEGPLQWESGSDYGRPNYIMIDLTEEGEKGHGGASTV